MAMSRTTKVQKKVRISQHGLPLKHYDEETLLTMQS